MNVLVLMAGGPSDAFREAGHAYPKNLVEIDGLPLVQQALDNLAPLQNAGGRFVCLVQQDENGQFHTGDVIRLLVPNATVLEAPQPTFGAACTALLAIEHINVDAPLLVTNGDQIVEADLPGIIRDFEQRNLDGGIVVFEAVHPRWSYVKCDSDGFVIETAEKRPISNLATAGMYYFRSGKDFVQAAMDMIKKDAQVGGNFYICPCYNELILKQARIGVHKIARSAYFSLATPQGAQAYEDHLHARQNRGERGRERD